MTTTDDAATLGLFHFPIESAALCAESTCGEVFNADVRTLTDHTARCPACGGAQWLRLASLLGEEAALRRKKIADRLLALDEGVREVLALVEGGGW